MTVARVNREVNAEIEFQPDWDSRGVEDFWCFPAEGVGDCEDFALEKRRRLVALGLSGAALSLAIVHHTERFFGHTLLLAETTAGTFVLDNLDDSLRCWDAVPYRYERREGLDGRWFRYEPYRARRVDRINKNSNLNCGSDACLVDGGTASLVFRAWRWRIHQTAAV